MGEKQVCQESDIFLTLITPAKAFQFCCYLPASQRLLNKIYRFLVENVELSFSNL